MSPYSYAPLLQEPGSIRLLRLLPNKDETAPIQCQLFKHTLSLTESKPYPYEALSYVWGNLNKTVLILIDNHDFHVTVNLHAALSRLRYHDFERILWIDAICINQTDNTEKGHQILSLVKIYSNANRVIVWLGKAGNDSDQALEAIRVAAGSEVMHSSVDEACQPAILGLLERQWFRRIWVLQEVAAARQVLMICGSIEIDGYAFCLGLNSLQLSHDKLRILQDPAYAVTYLIKGAIFRPRCATSWSNRLSLDISPLAQLIDMYHYHEATMRHDKVYALLGMSSDGLRADVLSPDYEISWKELLQRLVKFILSERVSVKTWNHREILVLEGEGCVLGEVVSPSARQSNRQNENITFRSTSEYLGLGKYYEWTLSASAKAVQDGDIVCLLRGASAPIIIRPCIDHFTVIRITAPLIGYLQTNSKTTHRRGASPRRGQTSGKMGYRDAKKKLSKELSVATDQYRQVLEPLQPKISYSHRFLLVWNWERLPEKSSSTRSQNLETMVFPECLEQELDDDLGKASRSCHAILILLELLGYTNQEGLGEGANNKRRFQEVDECVRAVERLFKELISGDKREFRKEYSLMLTAMENVALAYIKLDRTYFVKAERLLLQAIQIRKNIQGVAHTDTLRTMTTLVSCYRSASNHQTSDSEIRKYKAKRLEMLVHALRSIHDRSLNEVTVEVASSEDEGAMAYLLDKKGDDIQITEVILIQIMERSNRGILALLLDSKGDQIRITEGVVKAAAKNKDGLNMIKLLLDRRGDEVRVTEEVLKAVVGDERRGNRTAELLLNRKGNEIRITEQVLKAAVGNRSLGQDIMELLFDRKGNEIRITEQVLEAAAGNVGCGKEIMELLFDRRRQELQIADSVVVAAAGNDNFGKDLMELLLRQEGDGLRITGEAVRAAAQNWLIEQDLFDILLQKGGHSVVEYLPQFERWGNNLGRYMRYGKWEYVQL